MAGRERMRRLRRLEDVEDADERFDVDPALEEAFEDGLDEGRRQAAGGRRRPPARLRRQARRLNAPLSAQFNQGLRVIGLTLAVIALFLVLSSAETAARVIRSFNRAVDWLVDPTAGVPFFDPDRAGAELPELPPAVPVPPAPAA